MVDKIDFIENERHREADWNVEEALETKVRRVDQEDRSAQQGRVLSLGPG
jgi:hypothetical protein